ncbi:MAG: DUF86 domain-containing protein [Limnothrix sp. BL-A-16]|jgi:uncharacterized protein with HEPN domain
MSIIDDYTRLQHMRDAAQEAITFIQGVQQLDFESNRLLVVALVKEIEIIGEAANRISPDCQSRYPEIPWRAIIGMRNRLVHAYFEIDLELVWQVVTQELPSLLPKLESAILSERSNDS